MSQIILQTHFSIGKYYQLGRNTRWCSHCAGYLRR